MQVSESERGRLSASLNPASEEPAMGCSRLSSLLFVRSASPIGMLVGIPVIPLQVQLTTNAPGQAAVDDLST